MLGERWSARSVSSEEVRFIGSTSGPSSTSGTESWTDENMEETRGEPNDDMDKLDRRLRASAPPGSPDSGRPKLETDIGEFVLIVAHVDACDMTLPVTLRGLPSGESVLACRRGAPGASRPGDSASWAACRASKATDPWSEMG
jgi:hypothetical protein